MGREFELNALDTVGELNRDRLADALEEAMAARLVSELTGVPGRYRFSHALVRETIYEGMSALRRARLHLLIGEMLEALHGGTDAPLAMLAHHFFQAISLGQVEKAITYAVRAAERADRLLAYEEAVNQYEVALRALEFKGSVDETRRCELLLGLGEVQMKAGLSDSARETFERAATWARLHGSVEQLARAALGIGAGTAARTRLGRAVDDLQIGLLRDALQRSHDVSNPIRALEPQDGVSQHRAKQRGIGVLRAFAGCQRFGDKVF
jgi:tetratricopeptide (TPR) repeat protein